MALFAKPRRRIPGLVALDQYPAVPNLHFSVNDNQLPWTLISWLRNACCDIASSWWLCRCPAWRFDHRPSSWNSATNGPTRCHHRQRWCCCSWLHHTIKAQPEVPGRVTPPGSHRAKFDLTSSLVFPLSCQDVGHHARLDSSPAGSCRSSADDYGLPASLL